MDNYCPTTIARFWSKVEVKKAKADCWPWRASKYKDGYGRFKIGRGVHRAHRVAWEVFNGEELGDRHALHKCDNPECCNPYHLAAGSHAQNMAEMHERGRWKAPVSTGESNGNARLTADHVKEIRARIGKGEPN